MGAYTRTRDAVMRLLGDDGRHPAPRWCHYCGGLECNMHLGAAWATPGVTPRPERRPA